MFRRLLIQVRGNAVAYVALFVALSGTAFAASTAIRPNSVGTPEIKNRAVTGAKVALRTLTGANVGKATLTGYNIKSSTLSTVPNAAHLLGLTPTRFQRALTGQCAAGQAVRAVSQPGKVTCQAVGAGTVTGVTAATGLTGGGTSGNVSLAIDPTVVQARVTATCAAGRAMSSIKQDGTIGCHTTDTTEMMGGTGAATLSPAGDYLVPVGIGAPTTNILGAEVGSADAPSTARNLIVKVGTAPPTGGTWSFEFYLNGKAQTTLKCVIAAPATSCHENGSVPIPRGTKVSIYGAATGVTTPTTATYGWTDTIF
jgi:hypothetical protein